MKIFKNDGKLNFVDSNNAVVGFDNTQLCCEDFGWLLSRKVPTQIMDEEILDPEGFNFDVHFYQKARFGEKEFSWGAVFRLVKGSEEIFLTLYNAHNGYYSHKFELSVGGTRIHDGSL